MPEFHDHVLDGCRPIPLAGYLKALGVLRLLAEQADPTARGWWQNDRFYLRTTLDRDGLMRFFLAEYRPTPIIAPWNGRAGFLEGESEDGEASTREGAQLVRAYSAAKAERFGALRRAVEVFASLPILRDLDSARAAVKDLDKKAKQAKRELSDVEKKRKAELKRTADAVKESLLGAMRATVDQALHEWLDACVRIADENASSPLLIAGGVDGSRDYGMGFGVALQALFSFETGSAKEGPDGAWWRAAALDEAAALAERDTFGHFQPGQGGYNATTGYEGESALNPWDVVLALEGAVLWSGGVTRRLDATAGSSAASFPFTFGSSRAGSGVLSNRDTNRPPGELWCPLWARPTGLPEIKAFFREGRLTVGKRLALTGLDAALALQTLGRSRGVPSFIRVGLYQSDAKMPHTAAPLGRYAAGAAPDAPGLALELVDHPWLSSLRRVAREKNAPGILNDALREIDDSLFAMVDPNDRSGHTQAVVVALGRIGRLIASRPKLQPIVSPPPRLSKSWIEVADDGSSEFRLAVALAGLRASAIKSRDLVDSPTTGESAKAQDGGASDQPVRRIIDLQMCAHLGPLDPDSLLRRPAWAVKQKRAGEGKALAVWGEGALVDNLCAAARRRLVEQTRRGLGEPPFDGFVKADSRDIAAFLDGRVNDTRIADLLLGLAWVEPASPAGKAQPSALPFAYAALKPLFTPTSVFKSLKERRRLAYDVPPLPMPSTIPALLVAGQVHEAVRLAQERARASGLPTPFLDSRDRATGRKADPRFGRRLLAALVIPARNRVVEDCLRQAYPSAEEDSENAA